MLFGYFTLLVALIIETVGAYYSITGLAAIFSGAVIPILIMGASLEVGKVTAAVWLKMYWDRASLTYKLYLVPAVAFLMLLTSMGIFGFLSKAHSDQSLVSGDSMAKVAIYDEKINTSKDNIATNRKALKQMDEAVDQVMGRSDDAKGADKAVAIRRGQQKERTRLLAEIDVEQKKVSALSEERAPFAAEFRKVESEVGPIKYIAALIYGDNPDANILERAVRWVIILIVAVFDPLALVLILAAQQTLRWAKQDKEEKQDEEQFMEDATQELLTDIDLQEAKPEPSIWEKHPYLLKPFTHFKGLTPMVGKVEEPLAVTNSDSADNIPVSETVYVNPPDWGTTPIPEIYAGNPEDFQEPLPEEKRIELVNAMQKIFDTNKEPNLHVYDDERLVTPHDKRILAAGIDDVERPGDYLTSPDENDPAIKKAMTAWKEANPDSTLKEQRSLLAAGKIDQLPWLKLVADNALPEITNSGFGIAFPSQPKKGDTFVRVDRLPSQVFKYNGYDWILVDKNSTDSYTYDEAYIDHLIERIEAGVYDVELLSDSEREQVSLRLQQNNPNT